MRKPTGQMQEETQETLDEYNELYNWEYNDMCDFIENYGETEFLTYYETYHRLVDDYANGFKLTFDEEIELRDLALGVWEADDEDDLVDEITSASGWCIKSIDYEIQLK